MPRDLIVHAALTWPKDRAEEGQALARKVLEDGEADPALRAMANAWCGNTRAAAKDAMEHGESKAKERHGGYGPIVHAASKAGTVTELVREGLKLADGERTNAVVGLVATSLDLLDITGQRDELLAMVALARPDATAMQLAADRSGGMRRALCETVTDQGIETLKAADEVEHVATNWSRNELELGAPGRRDQRTEQAAGQGGGRRGRGGPPGRKRIRRRDPPAADNRSRSPPHPGNRPHARRAHRANPRATRRKRGRHLERLRDSVPGENCRPAGGGAQECDRLHGDPLSSALGEIRLEAREILPTPSLRLGGEESPREWAAHALAVATAPTGRIAAGTLAVALRVGAAALQERATKQAGGQRRHQHGQER